MFKTTISLPNQPLYLFTENKLKEELLDELFTLANKLILELNHNVLNSSAYMFNEANINKPFSVEPEFISFLEINLEESLKHKPFKPFVPAKIDIAEQLPLKVADNLVVKLQDISLNSSHLRIQFTLDLLVEFIKSHSISNFLLQYKDFYASIGDTKSIFIELENGEKLELHLTNEVTCFNYNANWQKDVKPRLKFASIDEILVPKYSITKNLNFINNKILSLYLHKIHMLGDFTMFVHNEKLKELFVIDEDDNIHEF